MNNILIFIFKVFSNDADSAVIKAEFKFLNYQCGYWDFPKRNDSEIVDIKYVFHGPCIPVETTKKGYRFEENEVVTKYNRIKRKNK